MSTSQSLNQRVVDVDSNGAVKDFTIFSGTLFIYFSFYDTFSSIRVYIYRVLLARNKLHTKTIKSFGVQTDARQNNRASFPSVPKRIRCFVNKRQPTFRLRRAGLPIYRTDNYLRKLVANCTCLFQIAV